MLAEYNMYDCRGIESTFLKAGVCSNCGDEISVAQPRWRVDGKLYCKDCMDDCKIEGE